MSSHNKISADVPWKRSERILFRIIFIYVFIYIFPLDYTYFQKVFAIHWSAFKFQDINTIGNYSPKLHENVRGNDIIGFIYGWGIAILGALIWSLIDRKRQQYRVLYYWMRVALRYKLAAVMFFYSFIKVFPQQMPYPSLSWLNTNLGDFNAGRLFWITTGVSQSYEIFTGILETIVAFLLFFRRTATFANLAYLGIMINIAAINAGYDAGILTVCINLVILSAILLAYDARKLWAFLIQRKTVALDDDIPRYSRSWQPRVRAWAKFAFIFFFFGVRGFKTYESYAAGGFRLPVKPGLPAAAGYYKVADFQVNHHSIPLSDPDTARWQNVVFEKWNSLSIKIPHTVKLFIGDRMSNYEVFGTAGRDYYTYRFDTVKNTLALRHQTDSTQQLIFSYKRPDPSTIILSGIDHRKDSLYVVLNKVDRKYPMVEGRYDGKYIAY
jgi:hypothetical protein